MSAAISVLVCFVVSFSLPCPVLLAQTAEPDAYYETTPTRADSMLEFVGMNSGSWTADPLSPTSLEHRPWAKDILLDLGIRHIRNTIGWKGFTANPALVISNAEVLSSAYDNAAQQKWTRDLYTMHGIRTLMNIGGISDWERVAGPSSDLLYPQGRVLEPLIKDQLQSIRDNYNKNPDQTPNNCIYAVEGQNEFGLRDNPATPGIPHDALFEYTKKVWSNRAIAGKQIVMPTLRDFNGGWPNFNTAHWRYRYWGFYDGDETTIIDPFVHYANFHHYHPLWRTGNTTPSTGLGTTNNERMLRTIFEWDVLQKKKVLVTECGTHSKNHMAGEPPQQVFGSEFSQAADINRYACELFLQNIGSPSIVEKMYYFSLFGEWQANDIPCFAILNYTKNASNVPLTYTPKPAYNALKGFLNRLSEKIWNASTKTWEFPVGTQYSSAKLKYTLQGVGPNTKHILFRRGSTVSSANGEYLLAIWVDAPVNERSNGTPLVVLDDIGIKIHQKTAGTFKRYLPYGGTYNWVFQTEEIPSSALTVVNLAGTVNDSVTLPVLSYGNWVTLVSITF
jgi:hypothetical protein